MENEKQIESRQARCSVAVGPAARVYFRLDPLCWLVGGSYQRIKGHGAWLTVNILCASTQLEIDDHTLPKRRSVTTRTENLNMDIVKAYEERRARAAERMKADLRAASEGIMPEQGETKVVAAVPTGSVAGSELSWRDIAIYPSTGIVAGYESAEENIQSLGSSLYDDWVCGRRFRPIDVMRLVMLEGAKRGHPINTADLIPNTQGVTQRGENQ